MIWKTFMITACQSILATMALIAASSLPSQAQTIVRASIIAGTGAIAGVNQTVVVRQEPRSGIQLGVVPWEAIPVSTGIRTAQPMQPAIYQVGSYRDDRNRLGDRRGDRRRGRAEDSMARPRIIVIHPSQR